MDGSSCLNSPTSMTSVQNHTTDKSNKKSELVKLNKNYKGEVIVLSVLDCMKIEWHSIYVSVNTSGYDVYSYFKNYYNKPLNIDIDVNGIRRTLKELKNILNFIILNPARMCLYIYF